MTKLYFSDLNDSQKQKLADDLLSVYPITCQNTLVEYVLKKSWEDPEAPFSNDDIKNNEPSGQVEINGSWVELWEDSVELEDYISLYTHLERKASEVFDHLESSVAEAWGLDNEELADQLQEKADHWEELRDGYQETIDNLEGMYFDDYPEVMQWFACDSYLIDRLEEQGQCTLDGEFWGRQTYGQSVTLDYVIQRIAFDYACDYGKDFMTQEQVDQLGA